MYVKYLKPHIKLQCRATATEHMEKNLCVTIKELATYKERLVSAVYIIRKNSMFQSNSVK